VTNPAERSRLTIRKLILAWWNGDEAAPLRERNLRRGQGWTLLIAGILGLGLGLLATRDGLLKWIALALIAAATGVELARSREPISLLAFLLIAATISTVLGELSLAGVASAVALVVAVALAAGLLCSMFIRKLEAEETTSP
jgi:hypothetical protein